MFRTAPLSNIRSFSLYTQQWYVSYSFADSLRAGSGRNSSILILLASCQQNLYDIYHCCVYSEKLLMMDRGALRNMLSFIPKIIIVHLVGFIIRIYRAARSPERQTHCKLVIWLSVTSSAEMFTGKRRDDRSVTSDEKLCQLFFSGMPSPLCV